MSPPPLSPPPPPPPPPLPPPPPPPLPPPPPPGFLDSHAPATATSAARIHTCARMITPRACAYLAQAPEARTGFRQDSDITENEGTGVRSACPAAASPLFQRGGAANRPGSRRGPRHHPPDGFAR